MRMNKLYFKGEDSYFTTIITQENIELYAVCKNGKILHTFHSLFFALQKLHRILQETTRKQTEPTRVLDYSNNTITRRKE